MPRRCTPGVFGTCARYMAANLPAPITPDAQRLALRRALAELGVEVHRRAHAASAGLQRRLRACRPSTAAARRSRCSRQSSGRHCDRREVAVRDVLRALEAADVVRHRAQAQVHADPVPRRQVRASTRAPGSEWNRIIEPGGPFGATMPPRSTSLRDRVVVDRPQRIAGRR